MQEPSVPFSALVVDDSPHIRMLLTKLLQRSGFTQIDIAVNGVEGLEHFQKTKADVVFLDAIMPEMDGLVVLREIKSLASKTVVVMTTSISEKEKVLQFKESGADYYLLKPFEDGKFIETLQKVITLLQQRHKEG